MFNLRLWLRKEQPEGFNVAAQDKPRLTEIMQSCSASFSSATTLQQEEAQHKVCYFVECHASQQPQ